MPSLTVNDYLAKKNAAWMGPIYTFRDDVGVIVHGMDDDERRVAYHADITYGTNQWNSGSTIWRQHEIQSRGLFPEDFFYAS